jgi:uncharacterized protein (DUF2147 family)
MKHRTFAPALGALAAVFMAAGVPSYASAADPSGIWAKDDGSAKMEVKKCGRSLCSKIVWLKVPSDSHGKPLHDALNENPSMRDRPIIGLPLFSNMVATETNTWVGNVYNPEEGKIYTDVKITLASRDQIVLRGCKAWLLCGEKVWTRSKLAPAPSEAEEPIEVKAPAEQVKPAEPIQPAAPEGQKPIEVKAPASSPPAPADITPKSMPKPTAPIIEAAREPIAEQPAPKPITTPLLTVGTPSEATPIEARVSVAPPKQSRSASPAGLQYNTVGLGLVTTATSHPEPLPLSGDNVSSMMVMTMPALVTTTPEPRVTEARVEAASADDDQTAPAPASRPKPKPKTLSADASESAAAAAAPHLVKPKPKPKPKEPEEVLPWLQGR